MQKATQRERERYMLRYWKHKEEKREREVRIGGHRTASGSTRIDRGFMSYKTLSMPCTIEKSFESVDKDYSFVVHQEQG